MDAYFCPAGTCGTEKIRNVCAHIAAAIVIKGIKATKLGEMQW